MVSNLNLFDHYSFRARLQPALITLLPAAIGVFAWTGPGDKGMSALWTLLGTAGTTYFLAITARNAGKQLEPKLWESWGGTPTTQLLRHSGPANPVLLERWHNQLARVVGVSLPTRDEETADPKKADQVYEAAVRLQIGKTRDTKAFPLVYKELVHYGSCRNLFALRKLGIVVSVLGTVTSAGAGVWSPNLGKSFLTPWVCTAVCLSFLAWWVTAVKSAWVKVPAFAYAERLFESTEKVVRAKASKREDGTTDK